MQQLDVIILDRVYKLACEPNQVDALLSAGRKVDETMRQLRVNAPRLDFDKIAVMAALSLCQQMVQAEKRLNHQLDEREQLDLELQKQETTLQQHLDDLLDHTEQLIRRIDQNSILRNEDDDAALVQAKNDDEGKDREVETDSN